MSIATELTRLATAKTDIKTAIENKGVTVPSTTKISGYAALIDQISTGTEGSTYHSTIYVLHDNLSSVNGTYNYTGTGSQIGSDRTWSNGSYYIFTATYNSNFCWCISNTQTTSGIRYYAPYVENGDPWDIDSWTPVGSGVNNLVVCNKVEETEGDENTKLYLEFDKSVFGLFA